MVKNHKPRTDVYAAVTDKIIEALEAGANGNSWQAPWHADAAFGLPENVTSHKAYRGVNAWVLTAERFLKGYTHPLWGTYKQWRDKGAQVKGGEKGTTVILWKPTQRKVRDDNGDLSQKNSLFATSFTVFNVAQVDGYDVPEPEVKFDAIEHAEQFFANNGAKVFHGGNRAYYNPGGDYISLPPKESFADNVSYYATSAHEHVHWTSHKSRCARDLGKTFGSDAYAAEELVAELGAAYVCGILGLANEPRADHAQYLASWLKVLKADPKAIVTASSKAQQAADYLIEHGEVEEVVVERQAALA